MFDEKLNEQFLNTHKHSNQDKNKFVLLLRKGAHRYEYMDGCENFNETSLPGKEDFYIHLNEKDIGNADYAHGKNVCKDFEMKNIEKYHDLHV